MSCDDLFWAKYNLSGALGREEGLKARIAELEKERDDLLLRNRETRGHLQDARDKLAELTAERDDLSKKLGKALWEVAELEKAKGNGHAWTCDCDVCAVRQMRWEGFPLAKEESQTASTIGNPPSASALSTPTSNFIPPITRSK